MLGQAAFLNSLLGQAAFLNSLNSPLASGSVGTDCSVYSQSAPHCAGSEVREEAQETQEESKRPGSVGTEVLHSEQSRLYTANSSSLQETVEASTSPREVRVKREDSTQRTAPVFKRL